MIISGRRKKHVELSAEQLINCDRYDSGCNTGNMFTAYEWIHENGGLATARAFHGAAATLASARSFAGAEMPASAVARANLGEDHHAGAAMVGEASQGASDSGEGELGIYFEELGAEDERRVLDSIESSLGSSNGNCPAELQLQGRVFGYCELDFEAGEEALMEAVSKQPVAIASTPTRCFSSMRARSSPQGRGPAPHSRDLDIMAINHAVVVTGWGEEWVKGRLIKYWILKNSFGEVGRERVLQA